MGIKQNKKSTATNGMADFTTYNFFVVSHALLNLHKEVVGEATKSDIESIQADAWEIAMQLPSNEKLRPISTMSIHKFVEQFNVNENHNHATMKVDDERLDLFRSNVRDCFDKNKKANPEKIETLYGNHVGELVEEVTLLRKNIATKDELIKNMNQELSHLRVENGEFRQIITEFNESVLKTICKFDEDK